MDRQTKLADLRLVSKHFPVSNYSYPRGNPCQYRHECRPQHKATNSYENCDGNESSHRQSRESNSPVPSMVEDHGSDDEAPAEDDLQYHVTGNEIWDSFWISHDGHGGVKASRCPAAIRAVANARSQSALAQPMAREKQQGSLDHIRNGAADQTPEWPLLANLTRPRARTQKSPNTSYSLFPQPSQHEKRPVLLPPRTNSRPGTPCGIDQVISPVIATVLPQSKHRKPAPLDLSSATLKGHVPLAARGPSPSPSAITSPTLTIPSPELQQQEQFALVHSKPPSRRPSLANLRKKSGSKSSKSTPALSYLAMAQAHKSESHLPSAAHHHDFEVPPIPPAPHSAPLPTSPATPRRPSTRPEVGFPPVIDVPMPPIPPMPSPPVRAPSPPRISFWLDSDSDSDGSDEESRSLARRILGGFAGHKGDRELRDGKGHKRSASDGRKGGDTVGKGVPVRRARADTLGEGIVQRPVGLVADERWKGEEKDKSERSRPRKQGNDVLGRMLGRRSR